MLLKFEKLLEFAIEQKASDIHIECLNNTLKYQLRTPQGFIQYDYNKKDLLEHIKYKSNLNLLAHNKPQTGVFSYIISNKIYYFRVASIKTFLMESCVIRILNTFYLNQELGLPQDQKHFKKLLNLENGLIIFSGPTGSGKTTTMYNLIKKYKNKKIYSIEDPIEIYLDNIVQTEVNLGLNYSYGEGIKQLLRHDPDIIVIGEIRDETAAKMAIRAALTGHLVITTLHATNIKQVENRLLDLGVNKYDLQDTMRYASNQRLISKGSERQVKYEHQWY